MSDLISAMVLVFVAELGNKTQLVALGFGARYRLRLVVVGIAIAYLAAGAVSVVVGALIGAALPTRIVSIGGGLLFIGFAVWSIVQPEVDPEASDDAAGGGEGSAMRLVSSVAVAMFIAEFGDKTMLATATLASRGAFRADGEVTNSADGGPFANVEPGSRMIWRGKALGPQPPTPGTVFKATMHISR